MMRQFRGTTVYKLGDTYYYLTEMQDRTIQKLKDGSDKDKLIKKCAYASGKEGDEIISPEGSGRTAIVIGLEGLPEKPQEEEEEEEEKESEKEKEEITITSQTPISELDESESGHHA